MTPQSIALWDTVKLVPLVFVLAVFQISSTPGLLPFGAGPDLVLVVVVALALWRGTVTAAVTGFFGGLLINSMVFDTLGTSSLLYVLAAFGVARGAGVDERMDAPPVPGPVRRTSSLRLVPWVIGAALGTQIADAILHVILGVDLPIAYVWWNQILPSVIQTGLAALHHGPDPAVDLSARICERCWNRHRLGAKSSPIRCRWPCGRRRLASSRRSYWACW